MSLEPSEVVVGSTGHIWRGDVNAVEPATISTAVDELLYAELGYVTEEGPRFNFGRETSDVGAWQSYDPIRVLSSKVPKEIMADLLQWNQNTWLTAMGGGSWSGSAPNYVYNPPPESEIDTFKLIVQFEDGDNLYRFIYRRVQNAGGAEFAATRDSAMPLPITFKVLAAEGGAKPFIFQTNDANLGDATQAGS